MLFIHIDSPVCLMVGHFLSKGSSSFTRLCVSAFLLNTGVYDGHGDERMEYGILLAFLLCFLSRSTFGSFILEAGHTGTPASYLNLDSVYGIHKDWTDMTCTQHTSGSIGMRVI